MDGIMLSRCLYNWSSKRGGGHIGPWPFHGVNMDSLNPPSRTRSARLASSNALQRCMRIYNAGSRRSASEPLTHASACPSAATASATISSNPDGSVARAAASSVQLPLARPRRKRGERRCKLRAGARRSRASITATSTSSRCTRCTPTRRCQRRRLVRSCGMDERSGVCACAHPKAFPRNGHTAVRSRSAEARSQARLRSRAAAASRRARATRSRHRCAIRAASAHRRRCGIP